MFVQTGLPCKWTSDSKRFILENFDSIQDCPTRIYNSALTLCPSSSWLHKYYTTDAKVVKGLAEWGACIRTVSFSNAPIVHASWNTIVAASYPPDKIIIFSALTGSQITILSGHTSYALSSAFSSDGTLLVSGSSDGPIGLWDIQTGGVVKTLCGHTSWVNSVSISADNTMIASGSDDKTIRLWNIRTGACHIIEGHNARITTVSFSPKNSQLLLSASKDDTIKQWSIDGHQIGSPVPGYYAVFSKDGAQFVSCATKSVTVRNTESKRIVVEFKLPTNANCCCFSPDGRLIAAGAYDIIYLWDISSPDPCLIQTLTEHIGYISSLVFPSSLTIISPSNTDYSIKFWQIGVSSADPVAPESESTSFAPVPIRSVSLQAKNGLAFSLDLEGVMKIWDILTGCCKKTYNTQARNVRCGDMQSIGGRPIIVWHETAQKFDILDAEKDELQTVYLPCWSPLGLRITGDGSRILELNRESIQAWSILTGESAGKQMLEGDDEYCFDSLRMDSSEVLVHSEKSSVQGWDFGIPGSTPTQFSKKSLNRHHLNFVDIGGSRNRHSILDNRSGPRSIPVRVEDSATGKEVFWLCGNYANPSVIQWDGQYLIAGYMSGEVLILDLSHVLS